MKFKQGVSGNPSGRPRGSPNKMTSVVKEVFASAFQGLGGLTALVKWAKKNPGEFYRLYARLIPVENNVTGSVEHKWRNLSNEELDAKLREKLAELPPDELAKLIPPGILH